MSTNNKPEAITQEADQIRCRHGVRSPHECRDCLQEQDQRWFTGPSQREMESILREQREELADALEALARYVRPLVVYEGSELVTGKYLLDKCDDILRKVGRS